MSFGDHSFLDLDQFIPETMIRPDAKILVVGQSGTGKTVMMLHILHCMSKKLDACFAFCPTRDTRHEYLKVLPKCFVGEAYNEEHLEQICEAQRTLHKRKPERTADGGVIEPELRRVGIVLDDCAFDKKVFDSKTMRYLMMNSRHENFFFMNGVQYVIDFPKDLRSQIQYVVVFPEPNIQYREPLRKNVLGIFTSDEQLVRTFDEGLQEHEALVFDQVAYRAKKQCLFYCKAAYPTPRFLVGSDLFWRMYYRHMVRESFEHIEQHIDNTLAMATGGQHVAAVPAATTDGKDASGKTIPAPKRSLMRTSEVLQVRRRPGCSDPMLPQNLPGKPGTEVGPPKRKPNPKLSASASTRATPTPTAKKNKTGTPANATAQTPTQRLPYVAGLEIKRARTPASTVLQ